MRAQLVPLAFPAASAAVAVALVLDVAAGEPPERAHPVALFGRLIGPVDGEWDRPQFVGLVATVLFPLAFAAAFGAVAAVAVSLSPIGGVFVAGICLFALLSLRLLLAMGREIVELTASDPSRARREIRALVGRDADDLTPAELRSGAVESLAENLADGFVAPLTGFVLGALVSLPVAVAGAAWVKGVNTLDSMLGYESKAVGWAPARLDDAVMWLPARVSALLIALAARDPGAVVRARRWADEPSSPNSGWPMATLAAVLNVSLRKPRGYVLNPDPPLPTVERANRGIRVVALAGALAGLSAVAFTALVPSASAWVEVLTVASGNIPSWEFGAIGRVVSKGC